MPLLCAVHTCALNNASCVSFKLVLSTGLKWVAKPVDAMSEMRKVMLENVEFRVGIGASQK